MDSELIWAAGFFDGEGCSYAFKPTRARNRVPRLAISHKDPRPLMRFYEAAGGGQVCNVRRDGARQWTISHGGALRVMKKIWPYLSEPKKEQFKMVCERVHSEWTPGGTSKVPPEWYVELIEYL